VSGQGRVNKKENKILRIFSALCIRIMVLRILSQRGFVFGEVSEEIFASFLRIQYCDTFKVPAIIGCLEYGYNNQLLKM